MWISLSFDKFGRPDLEEESRGYPQITQINGIAIPGARQEKDHGVK